MPGLCSKSGSIVIEGGAEIFSILHRQLFGLGKDVGVEIRKKGGYTQTYAKTTDRLKRGKNNEGGSEEIVVSVETYGECFVSVGDFEISGRDLSVTHCYNVRPWRSGHEPALRLRRQAGDNEAGGDGKKTVAGGTGMMDFIYRPERKAYLHRFECHEPHNDKQDTGAGDDGNGISDKNGKMPRKPGVIVEVLVDESYMEREEEGKYARLFGLVEHLRSLGYDRLRGETFTYEGLEATVVRNGDGPLVRLLKRFLRQPVRETYSVVVKDMPGRECRVYGS